MKKILIIALAFSLMPLSPVSAEGDVNTCPEYQVSGRSVTLRLNLPSNAESIPATVTYWPSAILRNNAQAVTSNTTLVKSGGQYTLQLSNVPGGLLDILVAPTGFLSQMFPHVNTQNTTDLSSIAFLGGDTDGNRKVDATDYNLIVTNFGRTGATGDLNSDGKVDIFDYNLLVSGYGKEYSPIALTSPIEGETLTNSSISIDGFTSSSASVAVFIDNSYAGNAQASADGSFRFDVPNYLSNGTHTVSVAVGSQQSHSVRTKPVTFSVYSNGGAPSVFGVNYIIRGECPAYVARSVKLMESTGIGRVRTSFAWSEIEQTQGQFTWGFSDKVVDTLTNHNVAVTGTLQYSPSWAASSILAPASPSLFANFAKQVVGRYKGKVNEWEIWNEENAGGNWGDVPNAASFATFLKTVYPAVKQANPNATVILGGTVGADRGGGLSKPDFDYLQGLYNAGAWNSFDSIGIHPYCVKGPADCELQKYWIDDLKAFIDSHGGNKTISITEYGFDPRFTFNATSATVSERDRADFISQLYLLTLANPIIAETDFFFLADVPAPWDVTFQLNGLFQERFSERLGATAYRTISSLLKNMSFESQDVIPLSNGGTLYYQVYKGNDKTVVALFTKYISVARVPVPASGAQLMNNLGAVSTPEMLEGTAVFPVSQSPVFIIY